MNCLFCDQKPLFKCACNLIYLCQAHLANHLLTPGDHQIENSATTFEAPMLQKLRSEVIKKLQIIELIKNQTTSKTHQLIETIMTEHKQALNKLESICEFLSGLLKTDTFFKSDLPKVNEFAFGSVTKRVVNVDAATMEIRRNYSQDLVVLKQNHPEKSKK